MSDDYADYEDSPPSHEERMLDELRNIHATLEEIKENIPTLGSKGDFGGWILGFVIVWLFWSWSGSKLDRWTDRVWYSSKYGATWKNVDVQKRPFDCDFFHAPIGDKGCHYKKNTDFFDNEKRKKLLEQTTLTDEERQEIKNTPNSVTVYWEKKPD